MRDGRSPSGDFENNVIFLSKGTNSACMNLSLFTLLFSSCWNTDAMSEVQKPSYNHEVKRHKLRMADQEVERA